MQWQELRSHIRHLPARDITRIGQAFELGKKMHEGQKRRSGEPYFNHPVAVSHMLLDLKADPDTIIAALLHDTVEDTDLTLTEIDRDFGGSVAALIDGVTKLSSKDVMMSPKLDEQIETLRKIFTLMQQDVRIMVIKLVDRLHNMQTVEFLPPERQKLLAKETHEVFVKIADKLCMQDMRDELESLCLAVLEPETYAALLELRSANEQRGAVFTDLIRTNLRTHDRILGSKIDLHFEPKTWDQMKAQLNVGGSVATGISFITVALVCEDIDACYRTLGALHQLWKREVSSFQDFINEPQLNGYRGLHTTIIAHDGTRIRCKIRTKEMHLYARSGITTKCFDSKAMGIADYLPWTKRLTSLANDTAGSSDDFWENLKSDILGESIIIYGPDDSTVRLPRNATALDGAFFLFQEKTVNAVSIKLNGIDVPFSSPLTNAASLDIRLGDTVTCSRDWLRQVETGFAAAKIRESLMKKSDSQKLEIGKVMLQETLSERKKGFIEEFDMHAFHARIESLGYHSLEEIYVSIADGRLEPVDVCHMFFEKPAQHEAASSQTSTVKYTVNMDSVELMDRINLIHRSYGQHLEDIHYHRLDHGLTRVGLNVRMDGRTLHELQQDLATAHVTRLQVRRHPRIRHLLAIVILVLLWGLDPIVAKMTLMTGVTPSELTFVRAWVVFGFASLVLLMTHRGKSLLRIPLHHPSLWMAGVSLFLMNLLTYAFLSSGSPLFYNTLLRINAVIIILPLLRQRRWMTMVLSAVGLSIAGIALASSAPFSPRDWILLIAIVAVFNIYTRLTSHFQSVARIQARYIQLFAMITMISAFTSLLLVPFDQLTIPANLSVTILPALYAIVFVGLPYMIFHAITDDFGYITISPWLNALVLVTMVAQPLLLGDTYGFVVMIPAAILLSAASLLASYVLRTSE